MTRYKLLIIFSLGFFSLLSQTLLFRDFLTVFDGNELSVGLFFFSWLSWVCLGALVGRIKRTMPKIIIENFFLLILLYLPAFILQNYLLNNSRIFTGVAEFEMFSLVRTIPWVILVNAPVSFITGFLFVGGCRWLDEDSTPVMKVYVYEALGSFTGALLVTILLALKFSSETVFLLASLELIIACLVFIFSLPFSNNQVRKTRLYQKKTIFMFSILAFILVILISGLNKKWTEYNNRKIWNSFLPESQYLGMFCTQQAKYLYGNYNGQFMISSWSSILSSLPDSYTASRQMATNLSQRPDAKQILVIGPGTYSICDRFCQLPQIKKVTWLEPDPEFPTEVLSVLPQKYKQNIDKMDIPSMDIRLYLKDCHSKFDLIILHFPDPSSLLLNRYFTVDFFKLLKTVMEPNSVLSVNFPGGENFMGTELTYLGSSIMFTLNKVFRYLALKPGESSCFFAANTNNIVTESPSVIEHRLTTVKGLSKICPAKNILLLFPEDRIQFQKNTYNSLINGKQKNYLLNSDNQPKSFFYSLLFSIKRLGNKGISFSNLNKLNNYTFPLCVLLLLIYINLRTVYFYVRPIKNNPQNISCQLMNIDILFIIATVAFASITLNIILIFKYQLMFGSLFLYFGIITSLFMLGIFCGGILSGNYFLNNTYIQQYLIPLSTILFTGIITLIYLLPSARSQLFFGVLFFIAGIPAGLFFPIAAFHLKSSGLDDTKTGSYLELMDHGGGALGGLLASLLLLPIVGTNRSLLFIILVLIGILFLSIMLKKQKCTLLKWRFTAFAICLILTGIIGIIIYNLCCLKINTPKPTLETDIQATPKFEIKTKPLPSFFSQDNDIDSDINAH